ncbi:unannotated protein [freshwater metagenome]|uniref:Unannotated protein n=1 Tax=freshwater metagenome TaxID=449393 RepID=A0A6J7GRE4_9ZZZZ
MAETRVLAPRNLVELQVALAQATLATRLLAGGTDLVLQLHSGFEPDLLIDVSRVHGLSGVSERDGVVHIGALTTFAQLAAHPAITERATCLARASAQVGSVQVRNVATIAGNVANASPCGDAIPALTALGTQVHTIDGAGRVDVRPLAAVLARAGHTHLVVGEAITGFSFQGHDALTHSAFAKVGARTAVTVSKLSMAVVVRVEVGTIVDARVALGSLAPSAFRDAGLEAVLIGRPLSATTVAEFAAASVELVRRVIPERSSMDYKQYAIRGVAYDVWNALNIGPPYEPVGLG